MFVIHTNAIAGKNRNGRSQVTIIYITFSVLYAELRYGYTLKKKVLRILTWIFNRRTVVEIFIYNLQPIIHNMSTGFDLV